MTMIKKNKSKNKRSLKKFNQDNQNNDLFTFLSSFYIFILYQIMFKKKNNLKKKRKREEGISVNLLWLTCIS